MSKLRISLDLALPLDWIQMAGGAVHPPGPRTKTYTVAEIDARIWRQVDKTDDRWLWTGYTRNGYGALSVHDAPRYVHRLIAALYLGDIPPGHDVCHRCDVPPCVRPGHLFIAPRVENVADMRAKGRARYVAVRGARHGKFRITEDVVAAVRSAHETERPKQRDLARRFRLTQGTVWAIVHRRGRFGATA